MVQRIKVVEIELSQPLQTLTGLDSFEQLRGLVRLFGSPIGYITLPISAGQCFATHLAREMLDRFRWPIVRQLILNRLVSVPAPQTLQIQDLLNAPPPLPPSGQPLVTVAVCLTERSQVLTLCLDSLRQLNYSSLELLLIDGTPEGIGPFVQQCYPEIRYIRETRMGLSWVRNRAAIEAQGDILAYIGANAVADPQWIQSLVSLFVDSPETMVVTGLVTSDQLNTPIQQQFEKSGFSRGCDRKWYHIGAGNTMPREMLANPWNYGTGMNMAYRRCIFDQLGYFDPALGNGISSELDMFFRVLKTGHVLVYEPSAIVRYHYPNDKSALYDHHVKIGNVFSYLLANAQRYPDERIAALKIGLWWTRVWHFQGLLRAWLTRNSLPRDLVWAEFQGSLTSVLYYWSRKQEAKQLNQSSQEPTIPTVQSTYCAAAKPSRPYRYRTAVRTVELTQPITALTDLSGYRRVRVFVTWQNAAIGQIDIWNHEQSVSVLRLKDAIVNQLGYRLLDPDQTLSADLFWATLATALSERYMPEMDAVRLQTEQALPPDIPVSIIVGTYDRPQDLRNCLQCLVAQKTDRSYEIIVTDNHPASGLTAPVVAEFPRVKLVSESRQGAAYARNAAITASTGEIVITVDDDTTIPPEWLEKLIVPFVRPDVMIVTGNVLPLELETDSQRIFENYGCGGLGRGFNRFEAARDWFDQHQTVVPTWLFGGTANAAFRASVFCHPEIGLMDEALGPGMPSGVGEDIYIFYQVLKSNFTMVYEPTAFVWHTHRRDMRALRRQLYNYSKGYVSYQLTTWLKDRDPRVLKNLLLETPIWHFNRIRASLNGVITHPISLILLEFAGNLAGPWSLWQSRHRVNQLGSSSPYIPAAQRQMQIPNLGCTHPPIEVGQGGSHAA